MLKMTKQQPSYRLYLQPNDADNINTLKDYSINVQAFLRVALKRKVKELHTLYDTPLRPMQDEL